MTSENPTGSGELKRLFNGMDFDLKAGDGLHALKRVACHFGCFKVAERVQMIEHLKNVDGNLHHHLSQYIENYVKLNLKRHIEKEYSFEVADKIFKLI